MNTSNAKLLRLGLVLIGSGLVTVVVAISLYLAATQLWFAGFIVFFVAALLTLAGLTLAGISAMNHRQSRHTGTADAPER